MFFFFFCTVMLLSFLFSSKFHTKMLLRNPGQQTEKLYVYIYLCICICEELDMDISISIYKYFWVFSCATQY